MLITGKLSGRESVRDFLGLAAQTAPISEGALTAILFHVILLFATYHELGHQVHGHP